MEQTGSACTLSDPRVKAVLDRLHREAKGDELRSGIKLLPYLAQKLLGRKPSFTDQYRRMADLSIPISAEQGVFGYLTARSIGARRIVEFGTSFGVSTLYFAAAIRDNGGGIVIGSEFIESKAKRARANIEEAGLTDFVEIRVGDAMGTLADPGGDIDLLLMDGSKDLYLPILKTLASTTYSLHSSRGPLGITWPTCRTAATGSRP
jgi:predicted O-methyltransferase YrrM